MCSCRLLLHGCAVRPIGAAMSRRGLRRRRVLSSFFPTVALLMRRPMNCGSLPLTEFGATLRQSASRSFGPADLVSLCAPCRRVRRGAFSLRLCAPRLISQPFPLAGSSPAFTSRLRAGGADAWFYVGRPRLIGCGCVVCVLTAGCGSVRLSGRLCSPAASSGPTAGRRRADLGRRALVSSG